MSEATPTTQDSVVRDVLDIAAPSVLVAERDPADLPPEEIARLTDDLIEAFKTVYDPEIPVDVYELGLIYKVDLKTGSEQLMRGLEVTFPTSRDIRELISSKETSITNMGLSGGGQGGFGCA